MRLSHWTSRVAVSRYWITDRHAASQPGRNNALAFHQKDLNLQAAGYPTTIHL